MEKINYKEKYIKSQRENLELKNKLENYLMKGNKKKIIEIYEIHKKVGNKNIATFKIEQLDDSELSDFIMHLLEVMVDGVQEIIGDDKVHKLKL